MFARLVFSLVLGLLMYVPRPVPKPPVDTVPPTPDDLPPSDMPDVDLPGTPVPMPEVDPPGTPIPMPDIDLPKLPKHRDSYPAVPPTPPPGYEGEWPPASERPDAPPTPPPGHEGPWPGESGSLRDRIREMIRDLRELLADTKVKVGPADADEGVKKLGTIAKQDPPTLEA